MANCMFMVRVMQMWSTVNVIDGYRQLAYRLLCLGRLGHMLKSWFSVLNLDANCIIMVRTGNLHSMLMSNVSHRLLV